ncbi:hypothetical protein L3Y34_002119 [Caenorhabditis briggsae]|uniref:Uncharacterized protein n=1 Tax=Caenorhabditis briggsae TaxID=6238 RepID=A0AAE9DEK4_CAEBR|nr:hypothetical protein L3Y34_002119 [Caenorhabditis briggsae]
MLNKTLRRLKITESDDLRSNEPFVNPQCGFDLEEATNIGDVVVLPSDRTLKMSSCISVLTASSWTSSNYKTDAKSLVRHIFTKVADKYPFFPAYSASSESNRGYTPLGNSFFEIVTRTLVICWDRTTGCSKLDDKCWAIKNRMGGFPIFLDEEEFSHFVLDDRRNFDAMVLLDSTGEAGRRLRISSRPEMPEVMYRLSRSSFHVGEVCGREDCQLFFLRTVPFKNYQEPQIFYFPKPNRKINGKIQKVEKVETENLEEMVQFVKDKTGVEVRTIPEVPLWIQFTFGPVMALILCLWNWFPKERQILKKGFAISDSRICRSVLISWATHFTLSAVSNRILTNQSLGEVVLTNILTTGTSAYGSSIISSMLSDWKNKPLWKYLLIGTALGGTVFTVFAHVHGEYNSWMVTVLIIYTTFCNHH